MRKYTMLRRFFTAANLLPFALMLVGDSALAQQPKPKPATPAKAEESPYVLDVRDGMLINPRGNTDATLENVAEKLRTFFPMVNIVMSPSLAKVKVGNIKLLPPTGGDAQQMTEILNALQVATGNAFVWFHGSQPPAAAAVDPNTGLPLPQAAEESSLYTLVEGPGMANGQLAGPMPKISLEVADGKFRDGFADKKKDATIGNIADFVRQSAPGLNIILAPGVAQVLVTDLKLHSADLNTFMDAIRVATGDVVIPMGMNAPAGGFGMQPGNPNTLTLMLRPRPERKVEVFNLGGYLQQSGKKDENEVRKSLDQVEEIILRTLQSLQEADRPASQEVPSFQFHPGANLLIVIGMPEAVEVARKVVGALPGQQGYYASPGVPGIPGRNIPITPSPIPRN